ncbi:MAG: PQQ-like beta-propeller repeat protein [Pirellulales bacterium]|nr:PQQ-like beta-propeller repeat protein [Pirellulales bacterium]
MKHRHFLVAFTAAICVSPAFAIEPSKVVSPEVAWELGWPSMRGPYGNFVVPQTGVEVVDDLADARLVWESKDTDFGRAKHTTGAFKGKGKVAALLGPGAVARPGGWAAPILAEGKLFCTTFRPAGKLYGVKTLFDTTEQAHLEAEDLLIALDAKTGKVIWKAAESGGFVWGVGKRGGFQVAPVYHDGTVFSMGTTGRVFAYAAADGKKLWETEALPEMVEQRDKHLERSHVLQASARYGWQQSLMFAGGNLIVPRKTTLIALDPKDGSEKWRLADVISRWTTPATWTHEKKQFLLCATGGKPGEGKLNLIDPAAGKVVWTVDGLDGTQFNLAPSNDHVLVNVGSSIMREKANASAPKNSKGEAPYCRLGAYKISPTGAKLVWSFADKPEFLLPNWSDSLARARVVIRDGLVFVATGGPNKETDRRLLIAREDTGEVLANLTRKNDFWFQIIGDKLLHCADFSHGKRASWNLFTADPKSFKQIAGPWQTDQPLTTSYQVFMEPPVIDGRIFLRTETGTVVCYDLRKR